LGDGDGVGNILPFERKVFISNQVNQVFPVSGDEIIHSDHFVTFGEHPVTKMRTEKAGSSGN
jgi:hypothetical protein